MFCKQEIEAERARVIPATRLCMRHGEQIQQFGGEFTVTAEAERTSKQGSMKLNYGGIATSTTRNEEAIEKLSTAYEKEQAGR